MLPISFKGTVVHGKQLGRTLGMPTANICPETSAGAAVNNLAGLPAHGVYISTTELRGKVYRSISNLGTRPSVDDGEAVNLETYIYDFDDDIYGEEICVTLLEFLRPEYRFASVEELAERIRLDIEAGRRHNKA